MNYLTERFTDRSFLKAIMPLAAIIVFFCYVYGAPKYKAIDVFCVGDSIVLGNKGIYAYSDSLQLLFDKEYGSGRVSVYNYSFFDMNTSQCLKLVDELLSKSGDQTEFIVIMAGEANYYNLNGFTDYLGSKGLYEPQNAFISGNDVDSVKKLNMGVAGMYNSTAAHSSKAPLNYAFSAAYRSIAGVSPKAIDGYVPTIIPSFPVLSENNIAKPGQDGSFKARHKLVWDFMNDGKYKEAEKVLLDMLRGRPLDSSLYYMLGSLYLADKSSSDVNEALKMFEEGVLVNPFDKSNRCYKGLSVMYMSYDGMIISELLYFSKAMKNYLGERIPEINAITAMNAADYDARARMVREWAVSDIKKIDELCESKGARLLVVDYPLDAKASVFLKNELASESIIFVENDSAAAGLSENSIYAETAKNVMEVINRQIKK